MRIFRIFMLIMLCSIFIGCSNANPYSKSGFYFDTVITITLFDNSNDELIDECFRICEELEKRIRGRRSEPEDIVYQRLSKARSEMELSKNYKYVVVNDTVENASRAIIDIINKCK